MTAGPSEFPEITTERLHLRDVTPDDVDALIAMFSLPEMLRFLNRPPVDTPQKALAMIDRLHAYYADHQEPQWGVTLLGQARLIGTCGLYAWDRENRHVDMGFHIDPARWGKGYATEVARAMIRWSFDSLDVHRIQADCTDGNIASERVMLKCGFKLEGVWRESCWEHGRYVNIKQFGLLRSEFSST